MPFHFTHSKVSQKSDGTDPTLVRPSDWNADHAATADGPGVVGRTAGGSGPLSLLDIGSTYIPSGVALPWFGNPNSVPVGWLLCNGQVVSRTAYPNLFAAIGVAFGAGDGSTTFAIPDCRGRTVAGMDPTGSRLTNYSMSPDGNTLGAVGGQQSMGARCYGYVDVNVSGTFSISGTTSGASAFLYGVSTAGGSTAAEEHTHTFSGSYGVGLSGSGSIRNDGNNSIDAIRTVQPTILGNWIIKT